MATWLLQISAWNHKLNTPQNFWMKAKRTSPHTHYNLTAVQEILPIQSSFSSSCSLEHVHPSSFPSTRTKAGCSTAPCPCSSPTNSSNTWIARSLLIRAETQPLILLRDCTLLNRQRMTQQLYNPRNEVSPHCLHLKVGIMQRLWIMQNNRYSLHFPLNVPNRPQAPDSSKSNKNS